jgi:hypothetical protein
MTLARSSSASARMSGKAHGVAWLTMFLATTACGGGGTHRDAEYVEPDGGMEDAALEVDAGPPDGGALDFRLLAPTSGSYATSRRPTLRWTLPPGVTGARVELCSDDSCLTPFMTFDVVGDSATPPVDLDHGEVLWRACPLGPGAGECPPWVWAFNVPRRSAPHDTFYGIRPDFDRDGDSDLAIGQPGVSGSPTGIVATYSGDPAGPFWEAWVHPVRGLVLITPNYGRSVSPSGDIVGSGGTGIVAGSAGNAYFSLGSEATDDMFGNGDHGFGFAVAGAGDVNGDGYSEILVGLADDSDDATGAFALVAYGGPFRASHGYGTTDGDPTERFGRSLSSAGDIDGDRLTDVIFGAPGADRAYVYRGEHGVPPSALPIVLTGPDGSGFGTSVACAGDVNGDGLADVIVGAPAADRAFVYLGDETTGLLVSAPIELSVAGVTGAELGYAVSGAGDVDGDGYGDVLVGAPSAELAFGRAYVFSGGPSGLGTAPSATLASTDGSGADFARAVGGVGDIDGDGYDDVVVGIPGAAPAQQGAADVFRGAMGGLVTTRAWRLTGHDMGYVGFGASIARAF